MAGREQPYNTDWNNIGPRFGFAWRPFGSDRWVIRGGYGIFFEHPFAAGAPNSASLGYELSAARNSPDNGVTPAFFLRDGSNVPLTPETRDDRFGAVPFGSQPTTNVSSTSAAAAPATPSSSTSAYSANCAATCSSRSSTLGTSAARCRSRAST
jgi:hypothetical protein